MLGILVSVFVLLHLLPVGLALVGIFNRRPRLHIPAIYVLISDAGGCLLANSIVLDSMFGGAGDWIFLGPSYLPIALLQALAKAPLWVAPFLIVGAVAGYVSVRAMADHVESRTKAFVGAFVGLAAIWVVGEAAVEVAMRLRASSQFASFCNFRRAGTPEMLAIGLSDYVRPSHAGLTAGSRTYLWSFREFKWVERSVCEVKSIACRCRN